MRALVLVTCAALAAPACRTRDDTDRPEAVSQRIVVGADTVAPEVIVSALAARLGATSRGGRVFCAYTPLGQEANRVVAWTLCQEFVASGDSVATETGFSGPALLVMDTEGGAGDLRRRLPASPGVKSLLPPGVMAELTGTVFSQFPEVRALRFRFDGSERAFWQWLNGEPRAFTRQDWGRI